MLGEDTQTLLFRGRRSRNKVSVGEPAEGSLSFLHPHRAYWFSFIGSFSLLRFRGERREPAPRFGGFVWTMCRSECSSVCANVDTTSVRSLSPLADRFLPLERAFGRLRERLRNPVSLFWLRSVHSRVSDRIEITQLAPMDILA